VRLFVEVGFLLQKKYHMGEKYSFWVRKNIKEEKGQPMVASFCWSA
jgi:hypothetical protein